MQRTSVTNHSSRWRPPYGTRLNIYKHNPTHTHANKMALSQRDRESRRCHERSKSRCALQTCEAAELCTVHLPLKTASLNISKALVAQIYSLNLLQKNTKRKVVYTHKQWCLFLEPQRKNPHGVSRCLITTE